MPNHDASQPDRTGIGAGLPRIDLHWDDEAIGRFALELGGGAERHGRYEALTRAAARMLDAPIACINLVDDTRGRLIARHGLDLEEIKREESFCGECVSMQDALIVEDAKNDSRFRSLPAVRDFGVGHYAGVPLVTRSGRIIGTLCVLGPGVRRFDPAEIDPLRELACVAVEMLEQDRMIHEYSAQRELCAGILDASMEGIYALRAVRSGDGKIVDFSFTMMSDGAARMLRTEASSVIGSNLSEVFPGAGESGLLARYTEVTETGHPVVDEILYDTEALSGWFEISAVRVGDGVAVTFRNIDERKRHEAELEVTNDRFRLLSKATEDIVWDYDVAAGHVGWNENLTLSLGYTREQIGTSIEWWESLIHPDEREEVAKSFAQAIDGDATNWSAEYTAICADGSHAILLDRAFIIRDESGRAIRAFGAIIDLTARRRASSEIIFQKSLLEAQAEASQDAILVTDTNHRRVQANRRFLELLVDKRDFVLVHEALRDVYARSIHSDVTEALVGRVIADPEMTLAHEVVFRDGRALELRSEPLHSSDGRFLGRVWFIRDLTQERINNRLLRAHSLVLEASNVVLFRWKPEPGWPVDLVSRNVEQFGYNADDLLARKILFVDIVHKDDHDRVAGEVARYIEEGCDSFEQEYRIVCADGSVRWIYGRTIIERDSGGNLESLQGVVLDITERRRVEMELAASEAKLKEMASQVPGALYQFRVRPDGLREFPYISDNITALCGITPEELYRDSTLIMSQIVPEDFEMVEASIMESYQTMSEWKCEFRILRPDGLVRWIGGNSIPRHEPDGSVIWHGLITDITARKDSEEKLRHVTVLLERTNALARVGGWELDVETGRVFYSDEVARICEMEPGIELTLESGLRYYSDESRELLAESIRRAIEFGDPYDHEVKMITAKGRTLWARAQGEPVYQHGRVVKLRGALHDINEQYQARQELARRAEELEVLRDAAESASRAKSEFIANMSHEIRTPLTAILGFAELLRDEGTDQSKEDRTEATDTIVSAGKHLLTIINDILDISKIEAGRMQIEPVETSLCEFFEEITGLMSVRARAKGIDLETVILAPIPERVRIDPTRFRQVMLNLVGNAVKFTDMGSVRIKIDVAEAGGRSELVIDIEDTGPGIAEEQLDHLFKTFAQADSSLRRRHGGSGLGLVIGRRCAELMGGQVDLVRTEIGRGSCFRVRMPIEVMSGTARLSTLDTSESGREQPHTESTPLSCRILLAEDGPANQRLISFHLKRAGAEVDVAANGRIALEMLRCAEREGRAYDLLLTDIQMPEMDGLELARHLRSEGSTIPVIAITAHAMTEDRARCLRAGCDDYTSKPIDLQNMLETCRAWLGRRGGEGFRTSEAA